MREHKNANGKKAFMFDITGRTIAVVHKRFRTTYRYNRDGSVTITNFDLNGAVAEIKHYPPQKAM
jgi:hypothetical protein